MRQERRGFCLPTRLAWTLLAGILVVLGLSRGFADEFREALLNDELMTLEFRVHAYDYRDAPIAGFKERLLDLDARVQRMERRRSMKPGVLSPLLDGKLGDSLGSCEEAAESLFRRVEAVTEARLAESPALPEVPVPTPPWTRASVWRVLRATAGDRVVVRRGAAEITVQLLGVDAPTPSTYVGLGEAYGEDSKRFLEELLRGEYVYLVPDPERAAEAGDADKVAYLFRAPDGLFVNLEVIRQGWGTCDKARVFKESATFRWYGVKAVLAARGMWRWRRG